jgi:hypothetical protein
VGNAASFAHNQAGTTEVSLGFNNTTCSGRCKMHDDLPEAIVHRAWETPVGFPEASDGAAGRYPNDYPLPGFPSPDRIAPSSDIPYSIRTGYSEQAGAAGQPRSPEESAGISGERSPMFARVYRAFEEAAAEGNVAALSWLIFDAHHTGDLPRVRALQDRLARAGWLLRPIHEPAAADGERLPVSVGA